MDAENEGVENKVLPPERKWYRLQNPPTIKYNDGKSNRRSVGCSKLIVGSHVLRSVSKSQVNTFNAISAFVEPTPPTNIIKNETILTQYSIKQRLKVLGKKVEATVRK